jgi:hypothetical protein
MKFDTLYLGSWVPFTNIDGVRFQKRVVFISAAIIISFLVFCNYSY